MFRSSSRRGDSPATGTSLPALQTLASRSSGFPRMVTVFPFLHSSRPGTGRQARGKSRGQKRKETPRILGVSEINIEFIAALQTERGRFELPVPCGTPVFKTGAIGRSAISPGRMLRGDGVCVNDLCDVRIHFLRSQIVTTGGLRFASANSCSHSVHQTQKKPETLSPGLFFSLRFWLDYETAPRFPVRQRSTD